ncbi:MAG: carboxypeptidase-like regulatory domain-containing protein, partial [Planctomycetota bacterium]
STSIRSASPTVTVIAFLLLTAALVGWLLTTPAASTSELLPIPEPAASEERPSSALAPAGLSPRHTRVPATTASPLSPPAANGIETEAGSIEIRVVGPAELITPGGARTEPRTVRIFARRRSRRSIIDVGTSTVGASLLWRPPTHDEYLVGVVPESLPPGWVSTGRHDLGHRHGKNVGLVACAVVAGESITIELKLMRACSLSGQVTDADGEPLGGVVVRAQAQAPGLQRLARDVATDADGLFRIEDLPPLVYSLGLVDAGVHDDLFSRVPRPGPRLYDLALGSESGIELALGRGSMRVSGRAVDGHGEGVPDLSVLIYYLDDAGSGVALDHERSYTWSDAAIDVRTDRRGAFEVTGLDPVRVAVQVGAQDATNGPGRRLRFVPSPVHAEPPSGPHPWVVLPDIGVSLSRRFVVSGKIVLGGVGSGGAPLSAPGLELCGIPFEIAHAEPPRPGLERTPRVTLDASTGQFTASCDTPRRIMEIRLVHRALPGQERRFAFQPTPDGRESNVVLAFP